MQGEDDVNREHAAAVYQEMAEQGDAFAQYKLGCCYYHGDGVGCDYQEAVKWFRKAAEQGNAAAQNSLGSCYRFGRGVDKNYAEAMKWYLKAAEQGYTRAQVNLGQMHEEGLGVVQNRAEAMKWYHKAATHRSARAQFKLGQMYEEELNVVEAERWYREAAGQGYADADRCLWELYAKMAKVLGSEDDSSSWNRDMGIAMTMSDSVCYCYAPEETFIPQKQDVIASAFAPSQVKKNSNLLVSVFLHMRTEAEYIKRLAREIQKDAERRSYKPLTCQLKDGDRVDVSLNILGGNKLLSSQVKNITWQGVHDSCTFRYFVTEDFPMDEICCEINLSMNNVPIGEMLFNVKIGEKMDATSAAFGSREFKKIFISYSHEDRDKVKYFADAYKIEGRDYFFDRHYLKSGDVYPEEIRNFINTSDLFILCWSANASKSEYVRKELSQALNLAYPKIQPREKARLTIRPISIDPRADPPDEMKDIYNFEEV